MQSTFDGQIQEMAQQSDKILEYLDKLGQPGCPQSYEDEIPVQTFRDIVQTYQAHLNDGTGAFEKHREGWMTRPNANLEALLTRIFIRVRVSSETLEKLLSQVSASLQGFQALRYMISRPEVAQDYRDLNYAGMLAFAGEYEQGITDTREVLDTAKSTIDQLQTEFNSLK